MNPHVHLQILIAHAPGEEGLADNLAEPLRQAGYSVAHRGTVLVGESVVEEASKALSLGGPVVLCGTVKAMGTEWSHRIMNSARQYADVRVFVVQMEEAAYVKPLAFDEAILRYWQDPSKAIGELLTAIQNHYPPPPDGASSSDQRTSESYEAAYEEFLKQKQRVEERITEDQ